MFYMFHRGGEVLRCEVRPSSEGQGYEISVIERTGLERVERHPTSEEVHRRWLELHAQFESQGWAGPITQDGRG